MKKTFSARDTKLLALSCVIATVGFLTACNTDQQLNCDSDEVAYHLAARKNDIQKMQQLEDTGKVNINAHCHDGRNTALMEAAYHSSYDAAKRLLESKVDLNIQNRNGDTALIMAAFWGHTAMVKLLLKYGAKPDTSNKKGNTALIWAASKGHKDIVDSLLAHGAKPYIPNNKGNTALIWAASQGHKDIVDLLLAHDEKYDSKDKKGYTAFMRSAYKRHTAMVKLLLKCDAKPDIQDVDSLLQQDADSLLQRSAKHDLKNKDGDTALSLAEKKSYTAIVDPLNQPNTGTLASDDQRANQ